MSEPRRDDGELMDELTLIAEQPLELRAASFRRIADRLTKDLQSVGHTGRSGTPGNPSDSSDR